MLCPECIHQILQFDTDCFFKFPREANPFDFVIPFPILLCLEKKLYFSNFFISKINHIILIQFNFITKHLIKKVDCVFLSLCKYLIFHNMQHDNDDDDRIDRWLCDIALHFYVSE